MVLAHWIQRFGQVLAPDPNAPGYAPREEGGANGGGTGGAAAASAPSAEGGNDDGATGTTAPSTASADGNAHTNDDDDDGGQRPPPQPQPQADEESSLLGGIWSVVAPDPNFSAPPSPPPRGRPPPPNNAGTSTSSSAAAAQDAPPSEPAEVECMHCHKMTSPIAARTTSAGLATPSSAASASSAAAAFLSPPSPSANANAAVVGADTSATELSASVLSAAKFTALAITSPTTIWESRKNFFILCASNTALNAKKLDRMRKKLARDPALAQARATDMDNLVYDGATPLHACAMAGNRVGALLLLGLDVDRTYAEEEEEEEEEAGGEKMAVPADRVILLSLLDLQGRTPLHVAAQKGQIQLVRLLKAAMTAANPEGVAPIGPDAPTDLSGRTPLGWAVTSRDTKARRNGKELERELFSPGDGSVCGAPTPAMERSGCFGFRWRRMAADQSQQQQQQQQPPTPFTGMKSPVPQPSVPLMPYGHSEMPGWRVDMEDALLHLYPLPPSLNAPARSRQPPSVGIFGVFDGHGDAGTISAYVARTVPELLLETDLWTAYAGGSEDLVSMLRTICPVVDERLREAAVPGSECGAFDATSAVSVGVVGSTKPPTATGGTTGVIALVGKREVVVGNIGDSRCILIQRNTSSGGGADASKEEAESAPLQEERGKETNASSAAVVIKPMSYDHKPDLPDEQARIEKAGLEVFVEELGEDEVIHKIKRGPNDMIAVSRAFGDFDYKGNADLPPDEQAIVCTPEIMTHVRNPSEDLYLVLACDGVWDVMTNEEVGEFVHSAIGRIYSEKKQSGLGPATVISETLPTAGDELIYECLRRGSRDNMSVLIVSLTTDLDADSSSINDLTEGVGRRLKLDDEV